MNLSKTGYKKFLLAIVTVFFTSLALNAVVKGVVNGDGYCTAADVTALYNWILFNDASNLECGDQNNDGSITAADVTAVYNIILGLTLPYDVTEYTINGVTFKMVTVDGGSFRMGATDEEIDTGDASPYDYPAHDVTLTTYSIGQTEVTGQLWDAVMGTNYFNNSTEPAYYITLTNIEEFIAKLNEATGLKFRLPTEAEWEFAARGGLRTHGYKYSGGDDLYSIAWFSGNVDNDWTPRVVAQKDPNELGLYDMSGNVAEWCQDWYSSTYYSESPAYNPQGPSSGSKRVLRGGRLLHHAPYMRVDYRDSQDPDVLYEQSASLEGMRLVLPY